MSGSEADYGCLARALSDYEQAERLATFLGDAEAWAWTRANERYLTLTGCARRCGYSPTTATTADDFARKRLATFERTFRRAA